MRARFRDEVAGEAQAAIDFYQADAPTAATDFEAEFRRVLQEIKDHPRRGSPTLNGTRRRRLQGFPYSVVYLIQPDHVYIIACRHSSQEWGNWVERPEDA